MEVCATLNTYGLPQSKTLPRPRSFRSGFTLIELMVVLVLIAIMTAVILPEMKGTYEDAILRSTSRKLVNVFHLASSRAIALNQLHRVRLDRREAHYVVERRATAEDADSGFVPVQDVTGCEGDLDKRITIEVRSPASEPSDPETASAADDEPRRQRDPSEAIAFYPDGTADAGELILRDRAGFRLSLQIHPATARVRIVELERE